MINKPLAIREIKDINTLLRVNCSIQTNNKSCYVLSCRTKGESLFFYNGETIKVSRGDILFIPLGSNYSQSTKGEEVVCIHMDISENRCDRLLLYKSKNNAEADKITDSFLEIAALWSEKKTNYYYRCMADIYNIVANYDILPSSGDTKIPSPLFPAVKYINENFQTADFNLDEACKAAHISRTYFNKLFKSTFKMKPVAYINELKISRAKNLLKSGLYTRTEIALLCGFKDVKNFYTFFKKQTQMTTRQYEKNEF